MKITIIGTGYVGLVSGTCFAELGNEVICVDIDEAKIASLKKGEIPIYEPGLEELVLRNQKEGRLHFTTDIKEGLDFAELVFSAVGTPPDEDHKADLSAVQAVAQSFGQNISKYTVFVNKSTAPVGTSEKISQIIQKELENRGKKTDEARAMFDVVDNPEFLREGAAIKDFLNPDRIVVGVNSQRARELMDHLYRPLVRNGHPLVFTDINNSEIIKYASNAFLATKISFINEVASFCEKAGGNVREVARGMGLDDRIGPRFLHAGIGYGGSCFPKDVKAFIQTGKENDYEFQILKAVEDVNEKQKSRLFEKIKNYYNGELEGKTFAVWGLAFKPKTDDMREAPSLTMIPLLREAGAKVQAFDPVAMSNAQEILGDEGLTYHKNALGALENADAVLIFTEWDEFRGVDLEELKKRLKAPVIFDGRNIHPAQEMQEKGFTYIDIGRKI
jgi:UDPglucose 6-dehydrogenase